MTGFPRRLSNRIYIDREPSPYHFPSEQSLKQAQSPKIFPDCSGIPRTFPRFGPAPETGGRCNSLNFYRFSVLPAKACLASAPTKFPPASPPPLPVRLYSVSLYEGAQWTLRAILTNPTSRTCHVTGHCTRRCAPPEHQVALTRRWISFDGP